MNPSELTLLVLRIGFLIVLWVFVFIIVYALRGDLFGARVRRIPEEQAAATPAAPASAAPVPSSPVAPAPNPPAPGAFTGIFSGLSASPTGPAPSLPHPFAADNGEPDEPEELGRGDDHSLAGLAIDRTGPHPVIPARPQPATQFNASRLVITGGPRVGVEYELTSEPLTIGRSSESGLVIRDDYTSTHHARLMLWNNNWMLQDLDSTNGTFLDGNPVSAPTQIPLDTPIKIGMTTFELRR